jgi:aquacobalamin reductase/NAD(P)H-flavin reductase
VTVLQDPKHAWAGPTGLVHEAVLAHVNTAGASLADFDIYIAGPFPMVGAVRDAFLAAGAVRAQMYADAFAWLK